MKPKTITKQYILCPQCEKSEHSVQHLLDLSGDRTFGPWQCRECKHEFHGKIESGDIEITKIVEIKTRQMLSLLKFRDIYVVVDFYSDHENDRVDWYDYLFHSHQCPTNIMGHIQEVFDKDEKDPHGLFRFVAAIEDNELNRDNLEDVFKLEELFKFFDTDGSEAFTRWPQENKGVLEFIARERYGNTSPSSQLIPFDVRIEPNADDDTKVDIEFVNIQPVKFLKGTYSITTKEEADKILEYTKDTGLVKADPLKHMTPEQLENFEPISKEAIDKALEQGKEARDATEKMTDSRGIDPKIRFK